MLILLTIAAVLIGIWTFNATSLDWVRSLRKPAKRSTLLNRQVSLWSLVLFLFFPPVSKPFEPKEFG